MSRSSMMAALPRSWAALPASCRPTLASLSNPTRLFSSSPLSAQRRERLRPDGVASRPPVSLAGFRASNPYFSVTRLKELQGQPPEANLDGHVSKKAVVIERKGDQSLESLKKEGERVLFETMNHWAREELNVMGTIREETLTIFIELLCHPSTIAPMATALHLSGTRENGSSPPRLIAGPPSLVAPASLTAEPTSSDLHYAGLFNTYLGGMALVLPSTTPPLPHPSLRTYLLSLLQHPTSLPHTSPKALLFRAAKLSGQTAIGHKKGEPKEEVRCAQLDIYGEKRQRKIKKNENAKTDERKLRKAELLRQRYKLEEERLVPWRRRLRLVSEYAKADAEAEAHYRLKRTRMEA